MRLAADLILSSRHLVALVGAGMSAESGIPTYRGPRGQWTRFGEPSMLSYQHFTRDPVAWWAQRLENEVSPDNPVYELARAAEQAAPNPGHHALVELERQGYLKCTITQNVDNLHRVAGSANVLEIHGNRTLLRCLDCGYRLPRKDHPLDSLPPRCPECQGIMKLDTVMFGEAIPPQVLKACLAQAQQCDCMLLIGTSGTVKPAARLPVEAQARGASLVEINDAATHLTSLCDVVLQGPSGRLLPTLVELVNSGGR